MLVPCVRRPHLPDMPPEQPIRLDYTIPVDLAPGRVVSAGSCS
jgi:hypothetical protein